MSPSSPSGLASILVPCCNQRKFTQLCLRALFRHTRKPWELIAVDNGSTDDTAGYLAGVQDLSPVPVTVITNSSNKSFPAAINQGLKAARGDYLVLLDNHAVVTDGWLDQLIALAEMDGKGTTKGTNDTKGEEGGKDRERILIGLLGPMSNAAPPPQLVPGVSYHDLEAMEAFARRWRDDHRGKWFRVSKLAGLCLLLKRSVYDRIGGLDERSGATVFDADDLAARARQAGFTMAVANDLFVHHCDGPPSLGSTSTGPDFLDETQREFARRVAAGPSGAAITVGQSSGSESPAEAHHVVARSPDLAMSLTEGLQSRAQRETCGLADGGVARPAPNRVRQVRVTLTMIVRDEEKNLPACLDSVRGLFDEMVVVDTGSVDRTREIAREYGAKVFEFPWIDDFAAARNAALGARHGRLRVLARCRRCDRAGPAGEVAGVVGRVAARRGGRLRGALRL